MPIPGNWRGNLAEVARFWESRRIAFNLILAAVVFAWVAATWPHFRVAFTLMSLLRLAVLALLAVLLTNYWIADEIYPFVR